VGEEGDTRSASHPSTSAQPNRMRVRSSKRRERVWEGNKEERVQSARTTPEKANVVNTGHKCQKKSSHTAPGARFQAADGMQGNREVLVHLY
jgi:hypothetical protein